MKLSWRVCTVFLGVFLLGISGAFASQTLLNPEQNAWLDKNNRTIVVHPQDSDPPFVFTGSGSKKDVKGFSVELLQAIARNLNIKITFTDPAPLDQILSSAREGNDGLILSLTPTEEREQYLYFTDSYYDAPAIIVARKDFSSRKDLITLSDFSSKKVAVGDKYAVESYIQANYPNVSIVPVVDDQAGLQKLLLGEVDAIVMDFTSFSYYTSNDALSYVKVIGRTGFDYKHSIAVPKSSPELVLILNQGLKSISNTEKQVIINKWVNIDIPDQSTSPNSNSNTNNGASHLAIWLIFAGFLTFIIATVIIVLLLRRRIYRTSRLSRRAEVVSEVEDEFQELKDAREVLKENISQITELEKDIEEKMHNIRD